MEEKCGSKRASGWAFNEIKGQRESGTSLVISKKFEGGMKETGKIESMYFYFYMLKVYIDVSLSTNLLANITKDINYTLILLTTPPKSSEGQDYRNTESINTPSHLELKRQLAARSHIISKDADLRPLFEKYQFFSPGKILTLAL